MNSKIRILILLLLILAGSIYFLLPKKNPPAPAELATPILAVEKLKGASIYFTPSALPSLIQYKPAILKPEYKDPQSTRIKEFAQAQNNPALWRQLDHRYRFSTILLTGDPAAYRPLLQYLLKREDFVLHYLDHTSIIFRIRMESPWNPADLDTLEKKFTNLPPHQKAEFYLQTANRLSAVQNKAKAKEFLEKAKKEDDTNPAVWSASAIYHAYLNNWDEGLKNANQALELDKNYTPALISKAQILYSANRSSEAYDVSKKLLNHFPNDPQLLFLHAKIAHQVKAIDEEVKTLTALIDLAEKAGQPTGGYRIYLGHAYAASGNAALALHQLEQAAASNDITDQQRTEVKETVQLIKNNAASMGIHPESPSTP